MSVSLVLKMLGLMGPNWIQLESNLDRKTILEKGNEKCKVKEEDLLSSFRRSNLIPN